MAFLYDLIHTYDSAIGNEPDGMEKVPPIAHQYKSTKEVVDVTLNLKGELAGEKFRVNRKNSEKTLIAMTEASSARTSSAATTPHALNDRLMFMTKKHHLNKNGYNPSYDAFVQQLSEWCESSDPSSQATAVLHYIEKHDIVEDMLSENAISADKDGKTDPEKYMKYMVRWRVQVPDGMEETWKNRNTIQAWTDFYVEKHKRETEKDLDCISGYKLDKETVHPKPILAYGNSKLISVATKEGSTLNFQGERFTDEFQLPQLGYVNSQKIHNALSWLIDTQSISISKNVLPYCKSDQKPKYLVCWIPNQAFNDQMRYSLAGLFGNRSLQREPKYQSFIAQMKQLITGRGTESLQQKKVSIFMIDRSGDGRLSPVMYKSFSVDKYLKKINEWYEHCAWFSYNTESKLWELKPLSIFEIVKCTYGVQRINQTNEPYLEVDDAVFKDAVNVLLSVVIDDRSIPTSMIYKLTSQVQPVRFSGNSAYQLRPFNEILNTACALLHWQHMRKNIKKGERDLSLDKKNRDRSYLYGRLLAVYDRIENAALSKKGTRDEHGRIEHRDTNAMRLWSAFVAHPVSCSVNLQKCVIPYLSSLPYPLRNYFQNELTEIQVDLSECEESNRPLSPEYLHGFYLERADLIKGFSNAKKDI